LIDKTKLHTKNIVFFILQYNRFLSTVTKNKAIN